MRSVLIMVLWLLPSLALAQGWSEGVSMDTPRAALAVTQMDGKIYAIGGAGRLAPMSAAERYNPAAGSWRSIAGLPVGLEQFGLAGLNGKLYAAGGYAADGNGAPGNEVWSFDEAGGEWVPAPAMPGSRAAFSMVAAKGKIYALGGSGDIANQMAVFDPQTKQWQLVEGGPLGRRGAVALAIDDNIYLIGGGSSNEPSGRMDVFNISSSTWTAGNPLPTPRSGHAAAVFMGKIHVMGGRGGGRGETLKDHWIFDPAAGTWSRGADLSAPRTGAGAAAVGASLYVVGGGSGGGFYASFTATDSVEVMRHLPGF